MDTDVDVEVLPYVQPDKAPKSGYLRIRQAQGDALDNFKLDDVN